MNKLAIIYCACMLAAPMAAQTQCKDAKLANKTVMVKNVRVENTNNNMVVNLDLNMDSLDLPSNMRLVFTPMVTNNTEQRLMPQIVVNGRKQEISYKRKGYKDFADNAVVVRRKNNTAQTLHYSAVLPYEKWMKNADVVVAEDLCGCGDIKDQNTVALKRMRTPFMPYMRPEAEARKVRHEQGRAFIDFPVDKITLYPEYRNNPRELDKIVNTINLVKNDKNTSITNVEIHGYASPESPYSHNAYLAENRAKTLKDYVRKLVNLDDTTFSVTSTPEDWEGLREYVAKSNLENRDAILKLIDNTSLDPDAKEWKIKSTYPADYRVMLDSWYPALRHSDYVVSYSVRPFSVEEAKEIMKTKPQQLSLEEMFMVAQTYEPGSREFNEVMATAVRMYPDNPTANINAACTRMEIGDLEGAKIYLDKAGNSPEALHAKGVLAMLEGKNEEARQLLQKAKEGGAQGVDKNLQILDM